MRILFIHQNLPGQFRHLISHLLKEGGHEIVGLCDSRRLNANRLASPREFRVFGYQFDGATSGHTSPESALHHAIRRGETAARAMLRLRNSGFAPDAIYGHSGWGEMLFAHDVFPKSRLINYCEFFFNREGQDFGFDPEFGPPVASSFLVGIENLVQTQSLAAAGIGVSPTLWQRSRYPDAVQPLIRCIHDGIDTDRCKPDIEARFQLPGTNIELTPDDEVVTYAARSLEPYRGFHTFMRAIPSIIEQRPNARVIVAGSDASSYSHASVCEGLRSRLIVEVGPKYFRDRVHFVGTLSATDYLRMLQVSSAHVYLTYPFVLSWSLLEAMAVGCLVIGSDTPPVREVVRDKVSGLLVDFFSPSSLAETICRACENPSSFCDLRRAAREAVKTHFDLRRVCIPAQVDILVGRPGS